MKRNLLAFVVGAGIVGASLASARASGSDTSVPLAGKAMVVEQSARGQGNNGKILLEMVLGSSPTYAGSNCTESPEGVLAARAMAALVGKTLAVEIAAAELTGECARAAKGLVSGTLPGIPIRMIQKPLRGPASGAPATPAQLGRVEIKIHATAKGPLTGPLTGPQQAKALGPIERKSGAMMIRDTKSGGGLEERRRNPGLLLGLETASGSTQESSVGTLPRPPEQPKAELKLEPESEAMAKADTDTAAQATGASGAVTKDTAIQPPLESKSSDQTSPAAVRLREHQLSVSLNSGLSQISNTGDAQEQTGVAASLQISLRGLFEKVRLVGAAAAVWPQAGAVSQGIFFDGLVEYELGAVRSDRRQGLLLLGGFRSFAATTSEQKESVRRIRPANESTPVFSNAVLVGVGHWSAFGSFNTLAHVDLAPVFGGNGFGAALSGRLTGCYLAWKSICVGVTVWRKDVQVGAQSGTAQFTANAAAASVEMALD